jgi:hypothetical protein
MGPGTPSDCGGLPPSPSTLILCERLASLTKAERVPIVLDILGIVGEGILTL